MESKGSILLRLTEYISVLTLWTTLKLRPKVKMKMHTTKFFRHSPFPPSKRKKKSIKQNIKKNIATVFFARLINRST